MTRAEHLLTILAEECAEVAKNISKTNRFGPDEVYEEPENPKRLTNIQRVADELLDLAVIVMILQEEHVLPQTFSMPITNYYDSAADMLRRHLKVERYVQYAQQCGMIQELKPEEQNHG